jgi:hypothetical protein
MRFSFFFFGLHRELELLKFDNGKNISIDGLIGIFVVHLVYLVLIHNVSS